MLVSLWIDRFTESCSEVLASWALVLVLWPLWPCLAKETNPRPSAWQRNVPATTQPWAPQPYKIGSKYLHVSGNRLGKKGNEEGNWSPIQVSHFLPARYFFTTIFNKMSFMRMECTVLCFRVACLYLRLSIQHIWLRQLSPATHYLLPETDNTLQINFSNLPSLEIIVGLQL